MVVINAVLSFTNMVAETEHVFWPDVLPHLVVDKGNQALMNSWCDVAGLSNAALYSVNPQKE